MEDFQLRGIETSPYPLNEWYWYVDDSETKCKEGEAQGILDHLNAIEPGVIEFTKEDQECDTLPVLDLKQKINRKTKKIECSVHYKKTHTNINVKERSNHPESMKRAIIKGFADRARALCDVTTITLRKSCYATLKTCLWPMATPERERESEEVYGRNIPKK